jgi:hypothetical protein
MMLPRARCDYSAIPKGKRSNNSLAVRRGNLDDALPDLPEFAPDWGSEIDDDLTISESISQTLRVERGPREQIPWGRKLDLFAAHDFRCTYCGARGELVMDHVIPVAAGGASRDSNLAPACPPCNRDKRAKPLATWLRSRSDLDISEIERRWREAGRESALGAE